MTKHSRVLGYRGISTSLATSCGYWAMWEKGELGVGVPVLSKRCCQNGTWFAVFLKYEKADVMDEVIS